MQISRVPLTAKSQANKTVPLDLLEADLAVTKAAVRQKTYELQNNPPISTTAWHRLCWR
jgi:hypothetical protein